MSTPANFNGAKPIIDPANTVMLLIDHQSGLFQTIQDIPFVVLSYQSCGQCRPCLSSHAPYCLRAFDANFGGARLDGTNGLHRAGSSDGQMHGHFFGQLSFATYSLVTERNAVRISNDVPLELMAPLGCGLQTGPARF